MYRGYTIPADMLGYPEAERQYAVDLTVDRRGMIFG